MTELWTQMTEFRTQMTEFSTCFTEFRTLLLNQGPWRLLTALSQMRSGHQEAEGGCPWGYLATLSRVPGGVHLATLRRFDSKVQHARQNDPLIPCERRLQEMEI